MSGFSDVDAWKEQKQQLGEQVGGHATRDKCDMEEEEHTFGGGDASEEEERSI